MGIFFIFIFILLLIIVVVVVAKQRWTYFICFNAQSANLFPSGLQMSGCGPGNLRSSIFNSRKPKSKQKCLGWGVVLQSSSKTSNSGK